MSKRKSDYYNLDSLQKRIIVWLAENGPQTMNEVDKNILNQYKAVSVACHSLEAKKFVEKVGVKEYRNRKYPIYWLTYKGVVLALLNEADNRRTKANFVKLVRNEQELESIEFMFKTAKFVGPKNLDFAFRYCEGRIKLDILPADNIEGPQEIVRIAQKYASYRAR